MIWSGKYQSQFVICILTLTFILMKVLIQHNNIFKTNALYVMFISEIIFNSVFSSGPFVVSFFPSCNYLELTLG